MLASWGPFGRPLGGLLGRLGGVLEPSLAFSGRKLEFSVRGPLYVADLGASWAVLGPSWAFGGPWAVLEPSWAALRALLGRPRRRSWTP